MRLKTISLKNYRCFEELVIDLHPDLNVIVGDNGNGKTSILDAIAIGISPFIGAFNQGKKKDIHVDDVRMTVDSMGQILFNHPARIELSGDFAGQCQTWARVRKSQKGRSTVNEAQNLIAYGKSLQPFSQVPGFTQLPLIRYYGICRLCKEIKTAIPKKNPVKYAESDAGYIDCLESASDFEVFQNWFMVTSFAVFEYEQALSENQKLDDVRIKTGEHWKVLNATVRQTINRVLKNTGWQEIKYNATVQKLVMFHDLYGMLGVDQLSSGIRTMIGLVADLAYRAVKLNPHLKQNAVLEAVGIVLIDEIDLHLHPSWQQHVLQDLQAAFPKIQFIVTTHSPQVLTTVKRESIRVLTQDSEGKFVAEIPNKSPLGHESGDALSYVMKVSTRPSMSFDDWVKSYEQLVRDGLEASDDAQNIKCQLDELGYEFAESDLQTWRFLASRKRSNT